MNSDHKASTPDDGGKAQATKWQLQEPKPVEDDDNPEMPLESQIRDESMADFDKMSIDLSSRREEYTNQK